MKTQISFLNSCILKATATVGVIMGFYFSVAPVAFASTPTLLPVTITTNGYVSFNCADMPELEGGLIHGFEDYSGTFPSTTTRLAYSYNPMICSAVGAGTFTLENWFLNGSGTTPDGEYWVRFAPDGIDYSSSDYSGIYYYFTAIRSGGMWFASADQAYIASIFPTNPDPALFMRFQQTLFNFTGKINNPSWEYDTLEIQAFTADDILYRSFSLDLCVSVPCSAYNVPYSVPSGIFIVGNYYYKVRLKNDTSAMTWSDELPFSVSLQIVADSTYTTDLDFDECSTLEIFCHLKNVGVWFFGVSDSTLQQFSSLTLENSLPFSYLYDVPNVFNELFANGGSASYTVSVDTGALGNVTFISPALISAVPFASTIKTIIGYLLYFMTIITLYHMLLKTHNTNHNA